MQPKTFAEMITFTRPGTATYIGADGLIHTAAADVPRFDYTNGRRQLLLEGPATNLVPSSESSATLLSLRCTSTQGFAAPDGSMTAIRSVADGDPDPYVVRAVTGNPSGQTQTFSVWLRIANGMGLAGKCRVYAYGNPGSEALSSQTIDGLTGDWQRIHFTVVWPEGMASTSVNWRIDPFDGIDGANEPPAGASMDHWGWQVEASAFATSYIPTDGSAVTRTADSARLSDPVAALLRRGEASLLVQGRGVTTGDGRRLVGGAGAYALLGSTTETQMVTQSVEANRLVTAGSGGTTSGFGAAIGYNTTSEALSFNGGAAANYADVPQREALSDVYISRTEDGSPIRYFPGWYDQIVIWPFRMTDADLVAKAVPYA